MIQHLLLVGSRAVWSCHPATCPGPRSFQKMWGFSSLAVGSLHWLVRAAWVLLCTVRSTCQSSSSKISQLQIDMVRVRVVPEGKWRKSHMQQHYHCPLPRWFKYGEMHLKSGPSISSSVYICGAFLVTTQFNWCAEIQRCHVSKYFNIWYFSASVPVGKFCCLRLSGPLLCV